MSSPAQLAAGIVLAQGLPAVRAIELADLLVETLDARPAGACLPEQAAAVARELLVIVKRFDALAAHQIAAREALGNPRRGRPLAWPERDLAVQLLRLLRDNGVRLADTEAAPHVRLLAALRGSASGRRKAFRDAYARLLLLDES